MSTGRISIRSGCSAVLAMLLYPLFSFAAQAPLLDLLSPATITALPRSQATATYRITNVTDAAVHVRTDVRGPAGWIFSALPVVDEVAAGADDIVFVSVTVPGDAAAGAYPVDIQAFDDDSGVLLRQFSVTIDIGRVEGIRLLSNWPDDTPSAAGQTLTQTATLVNSGNATENVSLVARGAPDWPATVSPAQLSLAGGASAEISVAINVPADVAEGSSLHLLFLEARLPGTPADQLPQAVVVLRTQIVLGGSQAQVGALYGELRGNLIHRATITGEGLALEERLDLHGDLGEGRSGGITAQLPTLRGTRGGQQYGEEGLRVYFNDLHKGFLEFGDISVNLGQPLLFYGRSGRGVDLGAFSNDTLFRGFYLQDRFGRGEFTSGAQIARDFGQGFDVRLTGMRSFRSGTDFLPQSETGDYIDVLSVYQPDRGNRFEAEAAWSESSLDGGGDAQRLYASSFDRGFYAAGELIQASPGYESSFSDETQARGDLSMSITADLRAWANASMQRQNPTLNDRRPAVYREELRTGIDWNVFEDTHLRYGRARLREKDPFQPAGGQIRSVDTYELAQRWRDFNLILSLDAAQTQDLDRAEVLSDSRLRVSGGLDLPRGSISLDYLRAYSNLGNSERSLREDYYLRSQLHVNHTEDLTCSLRYSPGSSFGNSGQLSLDWYEGYPQRWHLQLSRNFGSGDDTLLSAEYFLPLRVGLKQFPVSGTVSGRVYRGATGEGLHNVRLRIDQHSILTNEQGAFSLAGLPPGTHELVLDLSTVGAGFTSGLVFPFSFDLAAGETMDIDIPLKSGAGIGGTVVRVSDGVSTGEEPMPGVIVELVDAAGERQLRQTDGQGRFNFGDIAPGTYSIIVRAEALEEGMESDPPSRSVTIAEGEQSPGLRFLLKPRPRTIEITVEDN